MRIIPLYLLLLFGAHKALADSSPAKKISFSYEEEDLVNVINYVASQKNINVILPMRPDQKITGKITWHLDKKVTLDEAWNLLGTILDIAGYSIIPKPEFYEIVKTSKEVTREPVPVYIATAPENLPASDQQIRYIYYFSNIKLQAGEGQDGEINNVLKTLLPENAGFKIEAASNAVLIMAPSSDVRSVMEIIQQLDRPGFQEKIDIVPLRYAQARIVADLFNKKILQGEQENRYHLSAKKTSEAEYFSKHLRLIANERTNSIIMIGRIQGIERVKEFIERYIDVKPETGESILHVYQLQYLDAPSFAEVLNNIVKSKQTEGTEQSTAGAKKEIGPERFFDGVIIAVDTPKKEAFASDVGPGQEQQPKTAPSSYYGGNNLIIAARADDWKRIKKLIEELDKPKPQVLIEVLIADLTLNDNRAIGNMFRNAAKLPMPGEFNIQSAQLSPGIVPDSFDNPQTIGVIQTDGGSVITAADEGRLYTVNSETGQRSDATPETTGATSVLASLPAGTTALTLNDADGKTWSIASILKVLDNTKILSHPHVISTDNQEAHILNSEIRLIPGDSSVGTGGAIVRKEEQVPANLKVTIRPRISVSKETSKNKTGTINLQVVISVDEFISTSNNTRIQRNVTTNASVSSGDILAIGGLLRTGESNSTNEAPILSKIPLIGWLFKNKSKQNGRTNLTVFISPTIIEPRLRSGIGEYTQDYLTLQKSLAQGNLFDSLKDPVTRWFFNDGTSATTKFSQEFMKRDEVHSNKKEVPMPNGETLQKKTKSKASGLTVTQESSQDLKSLIKDIENPFKQKSAAAA